MLQGIEEAYCSICINAVVTAWRELMETPAVETLQKVSYGKGDTLGLDAIPEIIIADRLRSFDSHAILITEELDKVAKRRWPSDSDPVLQPLMFFSDPTDRSKQLRGFLERISREKPTAKVGELMKDVDATALWERQFGAPAAISGATTSITCVRKGAIIFSVILNYITRTIYVAVPNNVLWLELPTFDEADAVNLAYVREHGKPLLFPPAKSTCRHPDDFKRFVTFLGKTGYRENFDDSMIFVESPNNFLHRTEPGDPENPEKVPEPGGPARIFYLSELQKGYGPVGFILANGEKIGEWIHWLAFAKFAKDTRGGPALKVFEISIDRPWTKEGVLMSTSQPYSLFCGEGSQAYLDISRLRNFSSPSRFRAMLVITPADNKRILYTMRQREYREISFSF